MRIERFLDIDPPAVWRIEAWQLALAQTPGPDLAWQDAVMQSEAFIISVNSCIPTSRRTPGPDLASCVNCKGSFLEQ